MAKRRLRKKLRKRSRNRKRRVSLMIISLFRVNKNHKVEANKHLTKSYPNLKLQNKNLQSKRKKYVKLKNSKNKMKNRIKKKQLLVIINHSVNLLRKTILILYLPKNKRRLKKHR